jgi:CO/xanthine dehydrogenase Mo-binding subunit
LTTRQRSDLALIREKECLNFLCRASRATRIFGNATHAAALQVKEKLLAPASEILGIAKEHLAVTGDGAIRADTGRQDTWGQIAKTIGAAMSCQGSYKQVLINILTLSPRRAVRASRKV